MGLSDFHALVNYLTVGLIYAGIINDLVGRASHNTRLEEFGWTAMKMGLAFSILSGLTGYITESRVHPLEEVKPLINYHMVLSIVTVALLAGAVMLRAGMRSNFADVTKGAALKGAYNTMLVLTLIIGSVGIVLGTQLVHEHGVNVRAYDELRERLPNSVEQAPSAPSAIEDTTEFNP